MTKYCNDCNCMLMDDEEEAGFCGMCDGVIKRDYKFNPSRYSIGVTK